MRLEPFSAGPAALPDFGLQSPARLARLPRFLLAAVPALCLPFSAPAAEQLVPNGGFERGFDGWTRWGQNAKLITLEAGRTRSGTNCARIQHGHNALYFTRPLTPGQAYELSFAYCLAGANPSGQVALGFFKQGGGLNSAGAQKFKLPPSAGQDTNPWTQFRQVFLPTAVTSSAQFAFTAGDGSTLWLDEVSLRAVPRPAGLAEPTLPWEGLKRRTANPLFKELLGGEPWPLHRHLLGARPEPERQEGLQIPRT